LEQALRRGLWFQKLLKEACVRAQQRAQQFSSLDYEDSKSKYKLNIEHLSMIQLEGKKKNNSES